MAYSRLMSNYAFERPAIGAQWRAARVGNNCALASLGKRHQTAAQARR